MGNGTKFKFSNVLPSVFGKIKGIRRNSSVQKLSSSTAASVTSECAPSDRDQKDFSVISRECSASDIDRKDFSSLFSRDAAAAAHGNRSPSPPKRSFPQNKNGLHTRHTSSPVLITTSQKAYESACFPPESSPTIVSKGGSNKSRSLSPPAPRMIQGSAAIVDPGCCSFDSTMALVPHVDGRVRRVAPQALGKCLIMSKCNSFSGSTQHSDSEVSETDSSTTHARIRRHSRARSAQLEGSSSCEGYGRQNTTADERSSRGSSGKVSVRRRSTSERMLQTRVQNAVQNLVQNTKSVDQNCHLLYGGSSPIHPGAKYCRVGTDLDRDRDRDQSNNGGSGRNGGRLSRKLRFTTTDENGRPVLDDTSISSDDDFYNVVSSNGSNVRRGHHHWSRSTSSTNNYSYRQHMRGGGGGAKVVDTDLDYTSSEVMYTSQEDHDRSHAKAFLRRETLLAKTVLNAQDQLLSRFSHRESEKLQRRSSYDQADRGSCKEGLEAAYDREDSLVKAVLNTTQGWARENLRALAKANELDRHSLARFKEGSFDDLLLRKGGEAADKIDYEALGVDPNSREFLAWKNSRHPSPIIEEVEKYTEGRVDYKSSGNAVHEEFTKPQVADYASTDLYKGGARTGKAGKEFGKPWDTEFPSFRSDSILMGGAIDSDRTNTADDQAALIDCSNQCGSPAPLTPRYMERQRQSKIRGSQQQHDSRNYGKISSCSPSPREEMVASTGSLKTGLKNFKPLSQSASARVSSPRVSSPRVSSPRVSTPELSGGRPKRSPSPSPFQEFSNMMKKMPSRTPSPSKEIKGTRRSSSATTTPSSVEDFQQVKSKPGRTASPARSQSPQKGGGKPLTAKAEAGMQRLDSVAVVKASYDPYQDFRQSMVEMILENDIRTSDDLEDLLQCYLSLNSSEYHKIIVEVFTDVWGDIFDQ
ncbi:unnamed protein product [Calypogeia fissa]